MSDRPRAGRPRKLGTHEVRLALAELGDEATPDDLRRRLRETRGVTYSLTALRKILHRLGFSCKYPSKVQLNRAARLRRQEPSCGSGPCRLPGGSSPWRPGPADHGGGGIPDGDDFDVLISQLPQAFGPKDRKPRKAGIGAHLPE